MGNVQFFYRDENAPKPNKPNSIGAVVLLIHDGKILMEHRTDSDRWAFIGGGLNTDETLAGGALRELSEETGILLSERDITLYKIYDDPTRIACYPNGNIIRIITAVFIATLNEYPRLVCSNESKELRFFDKESLRTVNVAETHLPILYDCLNFCIM